MLYWMRYSLLFLTAALPGLLWAEPVAIQQVEIALQEERYSIDAAIHFEFNEQVLDALQHGVPLTIELQLQVVRKNAWFWEQNRVNIQLYRTLRFHALTKLYEIQSLEHDRSQSFATRDIAITALGEFQSLPLVDLRQLSKDEHYAIKLRASLDIESLPLTLRPLAYLTSDWNLTSGWQTYALTPSLDSNSL